MFDWKAAFDIVLVVGMSGMGLYVRSLETAASQLRMGMESLTRDHKNLQYLVSDMRESIPMTYATNPELQEAMREVRAGLQRIEDKLDKKADK